jgi:hypothetical protein
MLRPTEEVLDEVAFFVDVLIDLARTACAVRLGGNDDGQASGLRCGDDGIGVVGFVGDEVPVRVRRCFDEELGVCDVGSRCFEEARGLGDVVDVAGGEVEVDGVTKSVHESVDFGSETSARASNTLNLGPPFPPAECW